ncbi:hypothetical protein SK128_008593, partial [Halocaridina rubra]
KRGLAHLPLFNRHKVAIFIIITRGLCSFGVAHLATWVVPLQWKRDPGIDEAINVMGAPPPSGFTILN